MDAFLLPNQKPAPNPNQKPMSNSGKFQTMLFNPQPRQRFVFPTHNDTHGGTKGSERKKGPSLGGGGASGYKQHRTSKRERLR